MIDSMMKIFPEEMLKSFNMDISSIDTALGWLKSEGFVFILLITGIYSGILGSNILLKEESDKTIEYLNSLPVTRKNIATNKIICGIFYIILMVIIVGIFNFIGLTLMGDFDKKSYILLSITPIFSSIVIFSVCLFLSTFTHKTKENTWNKFRYSICKLFSEYHIRIRRKNRISKSTYQFLHLADVRNVIINIAINPIMVILSVSVTLIFILLTIVRYNKKELV